MSSTATVEWILFGKVDSGPILTVIYSGEAIYSLRLLQNIICLSCGLFHHMYHCIIGWEDSSWFSVFSVLVVVFVTIVIVRVRTCCPLLFSQHCFCCLEFVFSVASADGLDFDGVVAVQSGGMSVWISQGLVLWHVASQCASEVHLEILNRLS